MPSSAFFFVDGIEPDREAKRSMRSHVMKSKNAGKKFHRPSRIAQARTQPNRYEAATASSSSSRKTTHHVVVDDPPRNFGDPVALGRPPAQTNRYHNRVIMDFLINVSHHIYPIKLGFTLDNYKRDWLSAILLDEATYQVHVGLMQACNQVFVHGGHDSEKGLLHLSQGLVQVKKRLVGRDALSDSTMGIVLALVLQEQMRREAEAARVHFEGLSRMIHLRGGLDRLGHTVPLLLKVCKADIMLSLNHGMPPTFIRDEFPRIKQGLDEKIGTEFPEEQRLDDPVSHHRLPPPLLLQPHFNPSSLHQIFQDTLYLARILSLNARRPFIDIFTFQELLYSICYRALGLRPLHETRSGSGYDYDPQSAYQVGILFFVMTLFLQYDRRSLLEFYAIRRCLGEIASWDVVGRGGRGGGGGGKKGVGEEEEGEDNDNNEVRFWCLMIGGMLAARNEEHDWLIPRLRELADALGLVGSSGSWFEASRLLRKFPWIDDIHDRNGRDLWDEVAAAAV